MTDEYCLSIDLGTTNSCVGVWIDDKVKIIANELGSNTTPSVVFYDTKRTIVGEMACLKLNKYPQSTIYSAKRIIGSKYDAQLAQQFNYSTEADKNGIFCIVLPDGRRIRPEEVSAAILSKMKTIAESFLGQKVSKAVVTVPAYFNDSQRAATKTAGQIAGLDVIRMINEPTAACLCYGLDKEREQSIVLVVDFGGGTLDVSLMSLHKGLFEVVATKGNDQLGGDDYDLAMMDYWIKSQNWTLTNNQKNKLKYACEKLKKQLSQANEASYPLENFLANDEDFQLEMTIDTWNEISRSLTDQCLQLVKDLLHESETDPSNIDQIVLVGGATRMKLVQQRLSDFFQGKTLNRSINPDEAVAYGASVLAAILNKGDHSGKTDSMVLIDVVPISLGVETYGNIMSIVVPHNTSIPCEKVAYYTTLENNQTEVSIKIFQGERTVTTDCRLLGTFKLSGIPPLIRGIPKIKVTFAVDANGMLSITAIEETSKIEQTVIISADSGRLSEEEINQLRAEAALNRHHDEEMSVLIEQSKKLKQSSEDLYRITVDLATEDNKNIVTKIMDEIEILQGRLNLVSAQTDLESGKNTFEECREILDKRLTPQVDELFNAARKATQENEDNTEINAEEINDYLITLV